MRSHENVGGNEGGEEGDEEEETVEDSADGEVISWLERPGHRRVVHDQSPSETGFGRGGHVHEVDSQGVRGKSVEYAITVGITVEVVRDLRLGLTIPLWPMTRNGKMVKPGLEFVLEPDYL
jgi:hypothetical protein